MRCVKCGKDTGNGEKCPFCGMKCIPPNAFSALGDIEPNGSNGNEVAQKSETTISPTSMDNNGFTCRGDFDLQEAISERKRNAEDGDLNQAENSAFYTPNSVGCAAAETENENYYVKTRKSASNTAGKQSAGKRPDKIERLLIVAICALTVLALAVIIHPLKQESSDSQVKREEVLRSEEFSQLSDSQVKRGEVLRSEEFSHPSDEEKIAGVENGNSMYTIAQKDEVMSDGEYYGQLRSWSQDKMTVEIYDFLGWHEPEIYREFRNTEKEITVDIRQSTVWLDVPTIGDVQCDSIDDALDTEQVEGMTARECVGQNPIIWFTIKNNAVMKIVVLYSA